LQLVDRILKSVKSHQDHPTVVVESYHVDGWSVDLHIDVALLNDWESLLVAEGFKGQFSILAVECGQGDSITQLLNQLQQHANRVCCLPSRNTEV
jgi:hypothetical protein